VDKYFVPNFFPTLKLPTQRRYRRILEKRLLPALGLLPLGERNAESASVLCRRWPLVWVGNASSTVRKSDVEGFRNRQKIGFLAAINPAIGVALPEKESRSGEACALARADSRAIGHRRWKISQL
jgi:hypothetical protein